MRGKTKDEARAELEKEGVSGDRLERILPHKVNEGFPLLPSLKTRPVIVYY